MSSELSRPESVQSTPVSVGVMSSAFSDIESVVSLGDHRSPYPDIDADTENPKTAPVHPEFSFPDGNIEIRTTDQAFWVHEYHLNKFSVFATLIQTAKNSEAPLEAGRRIVLTCEQKVKGVDIYNTLQVIYASHIDGIPDFDSSILTSALRIASTLDYPGLRKFAISKLEAMKLPAIQQIQLSDEFSLPSFETPAFTELCSRSEPISQTEAGILGMTRFVEIARIRETQRTQWAVKLINGLNEDLREVSASSIQPGGSTINGTLAQDDAEYSSGRSQLPLCNCETDCFGDILHCRIHYVVPRILAEGKSLLEQRDELRTRLGDIQSIVRRRLERGCFPLDPGALDIKAELSRAPWIRRECNVVS